MRLTPRPTPSRPRRLAALALAALAGATVAGCSASGHASVGTSPTKIDPDKVERLAIKAAKLEGFTPAVTCPQHLKATKGAISWCTAKFVVEGKPLVERVRVQATGSGGEVYVRLIPKAKGIYFEQLIARIANQKKIALQGSTCPAEVERIKGETFTCTATVSGKPYLLTIRHTDWKGSIKIVSSVPQAANSTQPGG